MKHLKTTPRGLRYGFFPSPADNPSFCQPGSFPSPEMRQFAAVRHETSAGVHLHILACSVQATVNKPPQ